MRHRAGLILTLVVLIVLTPVVWASTAETWTDGIYDYEFDSTIHAAVGSAATVQCAPILDLRQASTVLGLVTLPPEVAIERNALPPIPARAPPLP
jgi:hypothetical protein